ncbi:cyclase [bacterium DOLZORAL124_64_63]|nr:MAG: cyclase [bacterium DOLZORAL124_64_63]
MKLIDLSHTIVSGMPQWPGDNQPLQIHRVCAHDQEGYMASSLQFGCHVGTHVDGPVHFMAGQSSVDVLSLDAFTGRALVVDATAAGADADAPSLLEKTLLRGRDLKDVDFVLLATGWDRLWRQPGYYRHWPSLSEDLAHLLAASGLKGVGLDTPSVDVVTGSEAHSICAAASMINIENLKGLVPLADKVVNFQALPLKLEGTEASPVRAVAWLDN